MKQIVPGSKPYLIETVAPEELRLQATRSIAVSDLLEAAGVSRKRREQITEEGRLMSDAGPVRLTDTLEEGSSVKLVASQAIEREVKDPAENASQPAHLLYQDPFIVIASKPAGILVHSDGTGREPDTLTAQVNAALEEQGLISTAQVLQRLDKDTSGCVLFSLCPDFQAAFDALVAGHAMHKYYLAVVKGSFPEGVTKLSAPLGRDRHDPRRMRVASSGKSCLSIVRRVMYEKGYSLVLVAPKTGRKHQIRVHLAFRGFPIVGDPLYGAGGGPALPHPERVQLPNGEMVATTLLLHCWEERFIHPVMGEEVSVRAPLTEMFLRLFEVKEMRKALQNAMKLEEKRGM